MKRRGGGSGKEDAEGERIAEADDFFLLSRMPNDRAADNSGDYTFSL